VSFFPRETFFYFKIRTYVVLLCFYFYPEKLIYSVPSANAFTIFFLDFIFLDLYLVVDTR